MPHDAGADGGARPFGGDPTAQSFASPAQPPTAYVIEQWLVKRLSEELGLDPTRIGIDQPFTSFGMSSVLAVSLSGELEKLVGRRLPPTLVLDYPTIQSVAQHLGGAASSPSPPTTSTRTVDEPIAVVGLACRFPGGRTPEEFWQTLADGSDAITEIPSDRWDINRYYSADPESPGKMISKWGGFLSDVDQFDASFFGISSREAVRMDPQQRLVLEVVWESLERAGIPPSSLEGSRSGVFVGVSTNDYLRLQILAERGASSDAYSGTGTASSVLSGRVAYLLGLQGPTLTVDTACSSSLVAVHLACRSLQLGESDLAIAGGVNLILAPDGSIYFSKMRALSPTGKCRAFDAAADGYVRGEGCGMVVLKRLSDAQKSGDPILALIRGSAVNHDGRSSGLTVPNGPSQHRVIETALAQSTIDPAEIDYVEAHGTGTPLGDPIEVNSIAAVYGRDRSAEKPVLVGSVKTQIGHLEAAAGIAGLIKLILSLQHEQIPASLHFDSPNPYIPWDNIPISVVHEKQTWPRRSHPRRGAVSAFGFSGTNVHMIVEESPTLSVPRNPAKSPGRPYLLTVSGRTENALRSQVRSLLSLMEQAPETSLADTTRTLATHRDHHEHRVALAASTPAESARLLRGYLEGSAHEPWITSGRKPANRRPRVAFVFSGQGSQWIGMAKGLLKDRSVFRDALDRCEEILSEWADWSLVEEIEQPETASRIHRTEFAQPIVCAIQIALAAQWKSWGVEPDAVIGHSMGELAAAFTAGALTEAQALRMAFFRGRLMQRAAGQGKMAAVDLSRAAVEQQTGSGPFPIEVAAENSPTSVVVSGAPESIEHWVKVWTDQGIGCTWLPVDCPFHSQQMEPLRSELETMFQSFQPHAPQIPFYSTVLGRRLGLNDSLDAEYWGYNMRNTVQFAPAFCEMAAEGIDLFIEVGVHPVLGRPIKQNLESINREGAVLASLRRGVDDRACLLASLGALHCQGVPVQWDHVVDKSARFVQLPTYPWQRERYWIDSDATWDSVPATAASAQTTPSLNDAFYQVDWTSMDSVAPEEPGPLAQCAIFDPHDLCGPLLRALFDGKPPVVVREERDLTRLLKKDGAFRGLLYFVHTSPEPRYDSKSILDSAVTACEQVVRVVCQLQKMQHPVPLYVVTPGMFDVKGVSDPRSVALTPLAGLMKSLAAEHPDLYGGLIDLDPTRPLEAQGEWLNSCIQSPHGEKEIAFRDGRMWVPRLVRAHAPMNTPRDTFRTDSAYLITGGLGGLGLVVARWMAEQGARRLILIGRTPIPPRHKWATLEPETPEGQRVAAIRDIESAGASVEITRCDVYDKRALNRFLEDYRRDSRPPIRGVVHAAGTVAPGLLAGLSKSTLREAFRAKVAGGWNLHTAFLQTDLDLFVLFSSVSTILESPGLASYAAANAFLDGLAALRKAAGRPAVSIDWGFWGEVGMGARHETESGKSLTPTGIRPLSNHEGLDAFGRLLATSDARRVVLPSDWQAWKQAYPSAASNPFLSSLTGQGIETARAQLPNGEIRRRLLELHSSERSESLRGLVADEIARILGRNPSDLDLEAPLVRLGFDSLMAVELRNWISHSFLVTVPMSRFFDEPSTADIARDLLAEMANEVSPPPSEPAAPMDAASAEQLLANIESLSDEEVERLLADLSASEDPQL